MRSLLILSLGPIQDFIAAARRCRDLWFGSWLLSDLSKTVARTIAEKIDPDALVFPGIKKIADLAAESDTSVANKIVAIVPEGTSPKDIADAAYAALKTRLMVHAKKVFDDIETKEKNSRWGKMLQREMAETQLEDLIEFLWVAAPIDGENYAAARKEAESLLAQRKRTMLWNAVPWPAQHGIPKSSLDGQRESVLQEEPFHAHKRTKESEPNPAFVEHLRKVYRMKPNERLCGVGLLKRLGTRPGDATGHQFLSTPHLATGPLLWRIEQNENTVRQAWNAYIEELGELGAELEETATKHHQVLGSYDGMLLMETRLEEWFDGQPKDERRKNVQAAQDALRDFFKQTKLPKPNPYFAVLLADGDNMGRAIGYHDSEKRHRDLSKQLDAFAQGARGIVEGKENRGELIYSGGDDVLAFVPLDRVIECARALADDFKEKLKEFQDQAGDSPTLSVGIAICHFIEPMSRALELARKAEKEAKAQPGKNALAIVVDKRSGPPTMACGTWGSVNEEILQFADWHRHDEISDGIAHELLELHALLANAKEEHVATLQQLVRKETERILLRKRPKHGEKSEMDQPIREQLLNVPEKLAERLLIARIIADAKDIAEGEVKPRKQDAIAEKAEARA